MARKVLLVDDEEIVLELLSATLGNDDSLHLLLARDGNQAVQLARQELPALVLLDAVLPGEKNGYQVCRELKEQLGANGIKIVMLTGFPSQESLAKAQEVGADGYFAKPFSPTALLSKIQELLSLHPR